MRQQGTEQALDIRTGRQAEEAAVGASAVATGLRSSGIGLTESELTFDTRAVRLSTTGDVANDEFVETDTGWRYRWDGTDWAFETGVYMATDATRTGLTISSDDDGAIFFTTDTLILWQVAGGAWAKRLEIKGTANQITVAIAAGVLTLSLVASPDVTTSYKVNGNQVVGARGAAVADVASADATDLASVITLANELKAQVNTAFARLRSTTGHGVWT